MLSHAIISQYFKFRKYKLKIFKERTCYIILSVNPVTTYGMKNTSPVRSCIYEDLFQLKFTFDF